MAQKLISKSFKTDSGCHVRSVRLDSSKRQADISYDCGGGGSGQFPLPEGQGYSNYPKALIKGVTAVKVPGGRVYGTHVDIGFVLSPRHVKCSKTASASELTCSLYGDGGAVLAGSRRKRRR